MFVLDGGRRLVIPRTELTYPGHNMRMHQNAANAPVDHVMTDFEDACPYEFKGEKSRAIVVEAFNTLDFGNRVVTVRPNNIRSKFFLGDIEAVMRGAVDKFHGIILPKVMGPEDIVYLSRLLDHLEEEAGWTHRVQIESLIETPIAVVKAYEIATASDRMAGLIFGLADFAAMLGVREVVQNQNQSFHYSKQAIVVAAKAAGLHAIDNVYFQLIRQTTPEDEADKIREGLRQKNIGARDLGMDGTWVIHPQQAEIANEVFSPPEKQIVVSKAIVEYYHDHGGGAMVYPETGEFLDEATIKGELMLLAKAVQAGKLDAAWLEEQAKKSEGVSGYDVLSVSGQRG